MTDDRDKPFRIYDLETQMPIEMHPRVQECLMFQRNRIATLEARLREVEAESQSLRLLAEGFAVEVEAERGRRNAPKGGQQVPNFGDFANMPLSAFQRLEWWARGIRKILAGEEW